MNTIPRVLNERVIRGSGVTSVLLVVAASGIIALSAQVAVNVPFTPVPLTLQPVAVLLVGVVLGSRRGAAAAMLYLLEGASGMPVFAQAHGGAIWLIGLTAGYLWSYPFAAFVAGLLSERDWARSGMFAGLAVIYAAGWSWLAVLTTPQNAFTAGVVPFIGADIVKIAIASAALTWSGGRLGRRNDAPGRLSLP
ncbi:MAG TPA: biotin transporter BioY [Thermoanaerobaculia bacterium]|nr:biotin transporter BioY [Thermoanaerobaculia bacterium]